MSTMAQVTQTKEDVRDYRIERFLDLRFSQKEAEQLADMVDANGFPVDWHKVKRAIEAKIGHKRAVWVFSREE